MSNRDKKRWQHHHADKTIRRVRKQIKRNRKPKRVRRKDWKSYSFDDLDAFDELDIPQDERIMPPGERERRRIKLALLELEEGGEAGLSAVQEGAEEEGEAAAHRQEDDDEYISQRRGEVGGELPPANQKDVAHSMPPSSRP